MGTGMGKGIRMGESAAFSPTPLPIVSLVRTGSRVRPLCAAPEEAAQAGEVLAVGPGAVAVEVLEHLAEGVGLRRG
jgi:hypothetical protein